MTRSSIQRIGTFLAPGAIFLIALAAPAFVFADDAAKTPACKDDIQRLCKKVKPGEGRIVKCLTENEDKITVGCKASLDEMKEEKEVYARVKNLRQICKADLMAHCDGVPKGKGRQVKCLNAHAPELSPSCRAALESEGFMTAPAKADASMPPAAPGAPAGAMGGTTAVQPAPQAPAGAAAPAKP